MIILSPPLLKNIISKMFNNKMFFKLNIEKYFKYKIFFTFAKQTYAQYFFNFFSSCFNTIHLNSSSYFYFI
jgi:hypothetical protein